MLKQLGALALAIVSTGCASFSTHLTPRPTSQGKTEIDAHVDVLAFTDDDGTRAVLPNVEMSIRYGLSDTVDIGGKLNAAGVEMNSRVALVLSDGFDLGVVPGAGVLAASGTAGHPQVVLLTFGMPLLAGVRVTPTTTLLLGAKFSVHIATGKPENNDVGFASSGEVVLYPGGVIGLELMLTDNFALFPEINFLFPYLIDFDKFTRPVYQGGLAFQFRFAS
jgi:hypothetical protein